MSISVIFRPNREFELYPFINFVVDLRVLFKFFVVFLRLLFRFAVADFKLSLIVFVVSFRLLSMFLDVFPIVANKPSTAVGF